LIKIRNYSFIFRGNKRASLKETTHREEEENGLVPEGGGERDMGTMKRIYHILRKPERQKKGSFLSVGGGRCENGKKDSLKERGDPSLRTKEL